MTDPDAHPRDTGGGGSRPPDDPDSTTAAVDDAARLEDGSLDPDELDHEPAWWDEGSDDEV